MKKLLRVTVIFSSIVLLASCTSSRKTVVVRPAPSRTVVVVPQPQSMPPGQAKKVYGSKSAKPFAPGQQKKQVVVVYPLIIVRTPSILIYTFSDGRHYYKNDEGMIYWLGKDDRFYLDDSYISKVKYDDKDYKEWKEKKDHADKGKDKEETNNSKEKEKGNKDSNSSSSNDQKKTKESKHRKG
jgi:hypothetical protein